MTVGRDDVRRRRQPRLPAAGAGPAGRRHGRGLGDLRPRPAGREHDLRAPARRVRPDRGWRGRPSCRGCAEARSAAASSSWCTSPGPTARCSASRWTGSGGSWAASSRASIRRHGGEVVFSVPDSSNAMALGFSEVSGIRLEHGLIRNHYVGRTFINPTQDLRVAKVKIKFNPVREVIEGRSVVVVDDSLVRGTTSKGLVQMIRAAGRPRSAPAARLAADHRALPLRHRHADPRGADRRHPLDRGDPRSSSASTRWAISRSTGMLRAAGDGTEFCHACFSGQYPVPIGATSSSCGTPPRWSRRPA